MGKRKLLDDNDSIDITGSASTSALRSQAEVIDLAEDSPPAPSGTLCKSTCSPKRLLCAEADVVVGRKNAKESKSTAAEGNSISAEDQRQKIMAHAALANRRKRTESCGEASAASPSKRKRDSKAVPLSASEEEAAKQAIMQHAAQLAPNNSLLGQLHAERLARQQLANPQQRETQSAQATAVKSQVSHQASELRLLTYNVWWVLVCS